MHVQFFGVAEQELAGAIEYYNLQRAGLGDEFLVEPLMTVKPFSAIPMLGNPYHPKYDAADCAEYDQRGRTLRETGRCLKDSYDSGSLVFDGYQHREADTGST